jgi:uncharacterized RDD family membrane protein YckC
MSYGYQGGPGVPGNTYDYPSTTQQAGYRYPQPPPPEPLEPEYAGFGVRFGARLLDEVFRMMAAMVVGFIAGFVHAILGAPIVPGSHFARTIVVALVADILYFAIAEGMGGATFGKMVLGLRVQREDGGRIGFGAALGRSFAYLLDAQFVGLVGYSAMSSSMRKQRYGDRWAHTAVVFSRSLNEPERSASPVLGAIAGLVLSSLVVGIDAVIG